MKRHVTLSCLLVLSALLAEGTADVKQVGVGPGPGTRYATDAYPGFDSEEDIISPSRKEPRWFSWINGPDCENAAGQFAHCQELLKEENWSKACKQVDALVREWPAAPESPKAQLLLAETRLERLHDYEDAFADYRYLLDFYSLQCDYNKIADKLYEVAGILKREGKAVMFVRFENTVDVRRAYETCVLRAPGASWVTDAMLTIAELRVNEGKLTEAVKVLENLRNLHPDTRAAKVAIFREAKVRMDVLREHEYNRSRCQDTIDFLKLAMSRCDADDVESLRRWLEEAVALIEDEAYRSAVFYDSNTRTRRSAINAYERYLSEYPASVHADDVRRRLEQLKRQEGGGK